MVGDWAGRVKFIIFIIFIIYIHYIRIILYIYYTVCILLNSQCIAIKGQLSLELQVVCCIIYVCTEYSVVWLCGEEWR